MTTATRTPRSGELDINAVIEDVEWMVAGHEWPPRIAQRIGVSCSTLTRALQRHGRWDLAALFNNHIRAERRL